MLGPHEFSTLMLVRNARGQLHMNAGELALRPKVNRSCTENSAEAVRCASLTGKCKTYPNALRPGRAPRQKRKLPGATMAWHRRNHVSLIQVESRRDRRVASWRLSGQLHIFEARHKFDHFAQGPILNQGNLKERT